MPHPTSPNATLRSTARAVQLLLAVPLCVVPVWVGAEVSDSVLSNAPLGLGASSTSVLPNVALVLDDSGSMAYDNMPGAASSTLRTQELCYGNLSYNTLAYDPTVVYKPPYKPDGVVPAGNPYKDNKPRYPDATFGDDGAWSNGYASTGAKNLSIDAPLSFTGTKTIIEEECEWKIIKGKLTKVCTNVEKTVTATLPYYYSTTATPSVGCDNDYYTAITAPTQIQGRGETGSAQAQTNYANWYSYYRTRAGMMKASTGEAFSSIDDKYRVGLFFLGLNDVNKPVKIGDFDATQKTTWFQTLYGSTSNNGTPLRRALSNMGRMYAGLKTELGDPMQFSCQQNFTILTTDGYWNLKGPQDLTSADTDTGLPGTVGDVDSGEGYPYKDIHKQSNTLADTALYYYKTDLRTSALGNCSNKTDTSIKNDLCEDNVPGSGDDVNAKQHMTTFTLGLGVTGDIQYEPNYKTAPDTSALQYVDIVEGETSWSKLALSSGKDDDSSQPYKTCDTNCPAQIDDLWHAAVNGRGMYYSASNPTSVEAGLRSALAGVSARLGSGAAAATSNLEPVAGDNAIYMATYRSVKWDGDLRAYTIDPATGALSNPDSPVWSAQKAIDLQVSGATSGDGRTIKYFNSSVTGKLKDFTFANLKADGKDALFEGACTKSWLTQCSDGSLDETQKGLANSGTNMVDYLRGKSTYEAATGATNPLYRDREHLLGDPVNAMPVYVKKPQFDYGQYDPTYNTFKTANASRAGNVYLAANDGMLHAIKAEDSVDGSDKGGEERWAYVPSLVMANMHKLADKNYTHKYFVDGSPTAADVCSSFTGDVCSSSTAWRTILVGGLNKGGCGYYALDITDPANPKGLWEFEHDQLGLSYGNPVITRRKSDGKWMVIFTSGYHNVPGTCGKASADGVGRVFVVDAMTGELQGSPISTGEGSVDNPSNLGKLNAWVDNAQMNIADAVYAGDMLGNLWRIDFDGSHDLPSAGKDAFKLATLGQPITIKPELAEIKGHRVVMVGTGKLLATSDLSTTTNQYIYGLKDDLSATTGIGNPRSTDNAAVIKARTVTESTNAKGQEILTVTGSDINWTTDKGWYLNLQSSGERLNVEMQLQYNILTAVTNVPEDNACTSGGYAWLYYIDIETGKNMTTATDSSVGYKLGSNSTAVGVKTVQLEDGSTVTVVSNSDGTLDTEDAPSATGESVGGARRTMWREILD